MKMHNVCGHGVEDVSLGMVRFWVPWDETGYPVGLTGFPEGNRISVGDNNLFQHILQ